MFPVFRFLRGGKWHNAITYEVHGVPIAIPYNSTAEMRKALHDIEAYEKKCRRTLALLRELNKTTSDILNDPRVEALRSIAEGKGD